MSKSNKLTLWQRFSAYMIWIICRIIAFAPRWVKYNIYAKFVYLLIYRCIRYRVKIVNRNLRFSFPDKSEKEIAKIRDKFYVILSEMMISTISLSGYKPEKQVLHQPQQTDSIERLKAETKGKSWVALTAHYGLWEYFMFWTKYSDQHLVAVYHKLENPTFEALFKNLRNVDNVTVVPINETVRYCLEHKDGVNGQNYVIGLIADQNPPRRPNSAWYKFLNQDTIFFDGGEKIARKLSLPVYFVYQRRIKPGIYEFDYEPIHNGIDEIESGEITRKYVELLEQKILEAPHMWLWTHRRWKHKL